MKVEQKVLKMLKELIDGKYDEMEFSYDFPVLMGELENEGYIHILDDMPEICGFYNKYPDRNEEKRLNVKYFDDDEIKEEAKKLYDKLIRL